MKRHKDYWSIGGALAVVLLAPLSSGRAQAGSNIHLAGEPGEWTRCVAWSEGLTFNIVNGQGNQGVCFALGRKCTGNPNARVTYYNPPVVVQVPYQRCTAS